MEVNRGRELACSVMEDSIKRHTSQASNSGTRASNSSESFRFDIAKEKKTPPPTSDSHCSHF